MTPTILTNGSVPQDLCRHPLARAWPYATPIKELMADTADSSPPGDLRRLYTLILEELMADTVVLYEGMVLDGWCRYLALKEQEGAEIPVETYTGDDPAAFVVRTQARRWNGEISQLEIAMRALITIPYCREGRGKPKDPSTPPPRPHRTQAEIAALAGVSVPTIRRAIAKLKRSMASSDNLFIPEQRATEAENESSTLLREEEALRAKIEKRERDLEEKQRAMVEMLEKHLKERRAMHHSYMLQIALNDEEIRKKGGEPPPDKEEDLFVREKHVSIRGKNAAPGSNEVRLLSPALAALKDRIDELKRLRVQGDGFKEWSAFLCGIDIIP